MLVEGVHFRPGATPESIGARALARGLSDIAAMAAEPRFCLFSVALPPTTDERWTKRLFNGLLKLAETTKCPLSGGDLSTAEQLTADIVVCGGVPKGVALRRDGARPGDWVYVSGPLGGNAAEGYGRDIRPRLDLAKRLRGRATACIDITDGLLLDLHRVCLASGVAADVAEVPTATGATEEHALRGGEDYELLFTSAERLRFPVIGRVVAGKPGALTLRGKRVKPAGYDHLAR
jgi:thiamine-monophosphate kinase